MKPQPNGLRTNSGGCQRKPITEELARLLGEQPPNANGDTWATMIAKALLAKASEGDVRAIAELANRTEGKPPQAMALDLSSDPDSNEITVRFVRPEELTSEEIDAELSRLEDRTGFTAMKEKIRELEEQLAKAGIPDRKF